MRTLQQVDSRRQRKEMTVEEGIDSLPGRGILLLGVSR
jgi:hypothetical protein